MVRFFFYILILTIVFLVGMVIGLEREESERYVSDEIEASDEFFDEKTFEQLSANNIEEQPLSLVENERLLSKLASFSETIVLGFYQVIVKILYQISKLFI
ncbi:MAG TPA: hypothetical protein VK056_04685 [Bacillota bacterium]|nr:hypothetical protein [Bacillota bacterium]